jgi:hypothetical protein
VGPFRGFSRECVINVVGLEARFFRNPEADGFEISSASSSGSATYAIGFGTSVPLNFGDFYWMAVDRVSHNQLTSASTIRHTISSQSVSAPMNQIKQHTE